MYTTRMYNSARLPSIANYDMAKRIYKDAVPYRGRYPEEKPLGKNRRYDYMQIHQRIRSIESEDNPVGEFATTYACQLYSTDCVEFYPDESIVLRVNHWRGPTTMMFLNYTLKEYIGEVQSASGKWYFVNKGGEAFPMPTGRNEELRIHFVEGHGFRPKNLEPEYKHKVRRKELNKLRKYYSDFIEYGKTMLMADNKLEHWKKRQEIRESLGLQSDNLYGYDEYTRYDNEGKHELTVSTAEQRSRFMYLVQEAMEKNDLMKKYELLQVLSSGVSRYNYSASEYRGDPEKFVEIFDELIKYHHNEVVFEKIEQEVGVPFGDRNERYIGV